MRLFSESKVLGGIGKHQLSHNISEFTEYLNEIESNQLRSDACMTHRIDFRGEACDWLGEERGREIGSGGRFLNGISVQNATSKLDQFRRFFVELVSQEECAEKEPKMLDDIAERDSFRQYFACDCCLNPTLTQIDLVPFDTL
jgi:hypothetical protein